MVLRRAAWAVLAIAALGACGSDSGTVNLGIPEGGIVYPPKPSKDGGLIETDGGSTVGPIVTVMTPPPISDPVTGAVLRGASVDVKCGVVQRDSKSPVDPTKVQVWVYAPSTIDPVLKVPAALQGSDLYGASVALDAVPSGGVRFRCVASDTAAVAMVGYGDVSTFYDAGPKITFTNLNDKSIIAYGTDEKTDLAVQFKVEPVRLAASDLAADVGDVQLTINGKSLPLTVAEDGSYKAEIDFVNAFPKMAIDSVTIVVTATNKRGMPGVTSRAQVIVKVDGDGPRISVTAPALSGGAFPIVGGTVRMEMTILDALAGVADGADKVYAVIPYVAGDKHYNITPGANNSYSFTFEAGEFVNVSTIYAQIHAFDRAGNKAVADFTMHLDTVPPWVSLNPRNVRECTVTSGLCSGSFDPLGIAPGDGEVIEQAARFRAMVWERGIHVAGGEEWIAGVRDETVAFYAQQDRTIPLLIDTDGDKVCDAVNNGRDLGAKVPFFTKLGAVGTGGTQPLGDVGLSVDPAVPSPPWNPILGVSPSPKCTGSDMSYVMTHSMPGRPPVVYASETASLCTGVAVVLSVGGGWTCVVAAARDRAGAQGNLGLSAPIHVCLSLKPGDCAKGVGEIDLNYPPLQCTDGCTLPPDALTEPYTSRVFAY